MWMNHWQEMSLTNPSNIWPQTSDIVCKFQTIILNLEHSECITWPAIKNHCVNVSLN